MSSGSYYEEEMSSGGHRRLTAFILWPFSPSKKSPLDPPSPWGWLGAYPRSTITMGLAGRLHENKEPEAHRNILQTSGFPD